MPPKQVTRPSSSASAKTPHPSASKSAKAKVQSDTWRAALRRIMDVYELTPTKWAGAAEVGVNNLYNFLNGESDSIGLSVLEPLAEAIQVPIDAVIGRVPYDSERGVRMLRAKQAEIAGATRMLRGGAATAERKKHGNVPEALALIGEDAYSAGDGSEQLPRSAQIAEVDGRAGMGGGGDAGNHPIPGGDMMHADDVKAIWSLPEAYVRSELRAQPADLRIIEATGDSMAPTINDGDRVAINMADTNPSPPGVFALWDGFGLVIKRLERIFGTDRVRVISDNPKHEPFERTADEIRIIGRVRWRAHRV